MKKKFVLDILKEVEAGRLSADDALTRLKLEPIEELGFARVDLHRELRQGATEVIYGAGKTPEQISKIIGALMDNGAPTVLTTRMAQEAADYVGERHELRYDPVSRIPVRDLPTPPAAGVQRPKRQIHLPAWASPARYRSRTAWAP